VRKQYHFWPAEQGFDAWDVDRLIALSRDLPVERVAVASISEIDTSWFDGSAELPTVRKVAEHARLIMEADLSYPIILGYDGQVMTACTGSPARCWRVERRSTLSALPRRCSRTFEAVSLTSCRIESGCQAPSRGHRRQLLA